MKKRSIPKKDQGTPSKPLKTEAIAGDRKKLRILFVSIFFISFSLLALEIILTRILSVLLSHHYVFVVVSVALLGLGTGSASVYFVRPRIAAPHKKFGVLPFYASLLSISIPLSVIILTLLSSMEAIQNKIAIHSIPLLIPFFLAGMFLAELFRMFPSHSSRLYGADLMGGAAGTLGVIPILNTLGGLNSSFFIGLTASLGAVLLATFDLKKKSAGFYLSFFSFLAAAGIFGMNMTGAFLRDPPIGMNPAKQSYNSLHTPSLEGSIIDTRWSAYGRTDLVKFNKRPEVMVIYIDGSAGSPMIRFDGNIDKPSSLVTGLKGATPGYFPFFFLDNDEKDTALIIGPGGGRDILLALMGGIRRIVAVEINKNLIDVVHDYAWFNGGIFTDFGNVEVVHAEGRSFVKRQKKKFDIIMLQFPYTESSRSPEGYVMTENFLFTKDAIQDYCDHLTEEGSLIIACDKELEVVRLVSTTVSAFAERGVRQEDVLKQVYTLGSPDKKYLFVLRKRPYVPTEIEPKYSLMQRLRYKPISSYFPHIQGEFNPQFVSLSKGEMSFEGMENFYEEIGYHIHPVTDNSPFFFNYSGGVPRPLSQILWATFIVALGIILVPFPFARRKYRQRNIRVFPKGIVPRISMKLAMLYAMLGCGFMLVEISLIQRFSLFLGQPVLSLAALLFTILLSAGLGSLVAGRLSIEKTPERVASAALTIFAILVAYVFLLPLLFGQFLGQSLAVRLAMTGISLALLGFFMGIPFPLGFRILKAKQMEDHIPWMWGINGVCSVLGAAITIAIAMSAGFSEALMIGAGCYLLIFLIFRFFSPLNVP